MKIRLYASLLIKQHSIQWISKNASSRKIQENNTVYIRFIQYVMLKNLKTDKVFSEKIQNAIDYILKENQSSDNPEHNHINIRKIKKDILYEYIVHHFMPIEYATYGFYYKSHDERTQYWSRNDELEMYSNGQLGEKLPDTKYERYCLFKPFFQREIIHIAFDGSESEETRFMDFINRHEEFVVKPSLGTFGNGVIKKSRRDTSSISQLKNAVEYNDCIIEELITENEALQCFHSQSVNTIRFASVMSNTGKFIPLYAFFRTGVNHSFVDNVSGGGIAAQIDINTGVIVTDGFKKYRGEVFPIHPNSKIPFKNYRIPKWDELCQTVKTAHQTFPQQKLFGWDFALTDTNEWVLVEINPRPSIEQPQFFIGGIKGILKDIIVK